MDVSIILVNYNTKELTNNCIDSIIAYTQEISYEIIIVDNNSQDGSADFFLRDKRVRLIRSDTNLGFGKANNLGVNYAQGKYVFLLNSDTLLLNNAVKHFFDFYEQHESEKIGTVGCVLLDRNNNIGSYAIDFVKVTDPIKFALKKIRKIISKKISCYFLPNQEVTKVDAVIGADMFMKRSIYLEFDGFDPDFFLYVEENEFQRRLANKGYERLIIKTPRIIHLEGGSAGRMDRLSGFTIYCLFVGRLLYTRKHFNKIEFTAFHTIQIIIYLPWVLFSRRLKDTERRKLLSVLLRRKI